MCGRCRRRQLAEACVRCQVIKPVAMRDGDGQPVCARCGDRPQRRCGSCGQVRAVGRRAGPDGPDICVTCYRMPTDTCTRCRRRRPCNHAGTPRATCKTCTPAAGRAVRALRAATTAQRAPAGRPGLRPLLHGALRRRGPCARCGTERRLVSPPGPAATTCADCAGLPAGPRCRDCGREDKLYERGRCAACSLRRRSHDLLRAGASRVPDHLAAVHAAICASPAPAQRPELAAQRRRRRAARRPCRRSARPFPRGTRRPPEPAAADYLRQLLVTHHVLPERDEALARAERRITDAVADVHPAEHRRLAHAYATWHVLRRLRRRAGRAQRPHTVTAFPKNQIRVAVTFLSWVGDQDRPLLGRTHPGRHRPVADHRPRRLHRPRLPDLGRRPRSQPAADRAARAPPQRPRPRRPAADRPARARLLHDDQLDLTDRVAGALLLLYGQHLTRIAALTTDQITCHGDDVHLHLGPDPIDAPRPARHPDRQAPPPGAIPRRGRLPAAQHLAVPRRTARAPAHPRPTRSPAARPRRPRHHRTAGRPHPTRRPPTRGGARRPPAPAPRDRRPLGSRHRRGLGQLRRHPRCQRSHQPCAIAPHLQPQEGYSTWFGDCSLPAPRAGRRSPRSCGGPGTPPPGRP